MEFILKQLDYQNFGALLALWIMLFVIGSTMAQERGLVLLWSARTAAAAALGHGLLMGLDRPPVDAYAGARIAFRSIVTGGLAWVIALITFSVLFFIFGTLLQPVLRSAKTARHQRAQAAEDRRRQRQDEEARKRSDREWRLAAPQRERQKRLDAERAESQRADQRRREAARLDCELYYAFHAADIQRRFSPSEFRRFVDRYLADSLSPAEVEGRARQLREIIKGHADRVSPPPTFRTLADIASWHDAQRTQAESVADDRLRRVLIAQLNERYAELASQFFSEGGS
jgi:hypothetical protein